MNPATMLGLWDLLDDVIVATNGTCHRAAELIGHCPDKTTHQTWDHVAAQLYSGFRRLRHGSLLQAVIERSTLSGEQVAELGAGHDDAGPSQRDTVLAYQRQRRLAYLQSRRLQRWRCYLFCGSNEGLGAGGFSRLHGQQQQARKRLDAVQRQVQGLLDDAGLRLRLLGGTEIVRLFQRWLDPLRARPRAIQRTPTLSLREQLCDNTEAFADCVRHGSTYFAVLTAKQLPATTSVALWDRLEKLDIDFDHRIGINIAVPPQKLALKTVRRLAQLRTSMLGTDGDARSHQQRGQHEAQRQSMVDFGQQLAADERLMHVGIQAVVWAPDREQVRHRCDRLADELDRLGLTMFDELRAHDLELFKTLPAMSWRSDRWRMVTAPVAADLLPKRTYSRGDRGASLLLETAHTREPFGLSLRSRTRANDNFLVFGASGAGKSVLVNLMLAYSMLAGRDKGRVIAIDYAGPTKSTFRIATEVFSGKYIAISGDGAKINPWPTKAQATGADGHVRHDVLAFLTQLSDLLLHNEGDSKDDALFQALIQKAIVRVYDRWEQDTAPLFQDMANALADMAFDSPEEQSRRGTLQQLVEKFLEGPEAALLNTPTTAESDGALVVYDLFGLKAFKRARVQAAVAWAVAEHVRRIAFDDHPERKKTILFDEAANLLDVGMQQTMHEMLTTARAHGTSVGIITQDYSRYREAGLSTLFNVNTTQKLFMSHEHAADLIDTIADDLRLNPRQRETFRECRAVKGKYSEMLVLSSTEGASGHDEHIATKVRIMLSPFDYQVVTSDAGDRARQQRLHRARPNASKVELLDFLARDTHASAGGLP